MTTRQATQTSKFLSLILRHKPEAVGLQLDGQGWADIPDLLGKMAAHGNPLTPDELTELVRGNGKQRFAFSDDGTKIRSGAMARGGMPFFLSANGVWLTDAVPPQYIDADGASDTAKFTPCPGEL